MPRRNGSIERGSVPHSTPLVSMVLLTEERRHQWLTRVSSIWKDDPTMYEQSAAEKKLFAYGVSGIMSYAGGATLPDPLLLFLSPQE